LSYGRNVAFGPIIRRFPAAGNACPARRSPAQRSAQPGMLA